VTINAYGLVWPKLQSYLLRQFNLKELTIGHNPLRLENDKFIVYLPNELSPVSETSPCPMDEW
jgi:hypothetical protein